MELRNISEDEFDALHRLVSTAFGEDSPEESRRFERRFFEFDRSIAGVGPTPCSPRPRRRFATGTSELGFGLAATPA